MSEQNSKRRTGPKKRRRLLISSFILLLIAGVVTAFAIGQLPNWISLVAKRPDRHVSYKIRKSPFIVQIPATGELQASASTPISVPGVRTGGLKIFWLIKDGSLVRKGDTLVEFDASELIQQMQETESNLEATLRQLEATVVRSNSDIGEIETDRDIAAMELEKAKTQAPRNEDIFTRHQIIEGELSIDLSNTKMKEWSGKIDTKKNIGSTSQRILIIERKQHDTKKNLLEQSLGSLKILAPHDGLVLYQKDQSGNSVNVGETRWPGYTLLTIPDVSSMKARIHVLESDAGNLKVGQKASITIDSHANIQFNASIERIDALARPLDKDSPVKYVEVILKVEGSDSDILKPGKLLHAEIIIAYYPEAIVIPRVAVIEEALKSYIWIESSDGPQKREIETGTGDAARVVVLSGILEGESVLLNPPKANGVGTGQGNAFPETIPGS